MSSALAYQIKANVSMVQAAQCYGLEVDRRGFARCPFHAEKSASLKVYEGDRGFYCFGCHSSGDVIDFVRQYYMLDYPTAVDKLNTDFALGLPTRRKPTQQERSQMAQIARQRARDREAMKRAVNATETAYWVEFDRWWWLETCALDYRPQNANDEINQMYTYAMHELPAQRDALKRAEFERWKARCRNSPDALSCPSQ